jgi:thioredoxin
VLVSYSCGQNAESNSNSANDQSVPEKNAVTEQKSSSGDIKPVYLTTADFKKKIWDYDTNPQDFVYQGDLPCVIDFYADWCKPCKIVAPIMDDLADYYDGKVIIYKVNTDKERELASVFQVNSIPSILFTPMTGKPAMQPGALSKDEYIKIIDEFILKVKTENSKKI